MTKILIMMESEHFDRLHSADVAYLLYTILQYLSNDTLDSTPCTSSQQQTQSLGVYEQMGHSQIVLQS